MIRKFFGTDGIRGVANRALTAELAMAVGRAAVAVLPGDAPRVLIGRDTRISGSMLEAALVAGINSSGGQAMIAGVIPTPAVASLVVSESADAGAVISASHNPYQDNGIKFFGPSGFKFSDVQELEMEGYLAGDETLPPLPADPGRSFILKHPVTDYVDNLLGGFDLDLTGLGILVDCANGATFRSAPQALKLLGARVALINDNPDGFNINRGCGSTHIGALQAGVRTDGFDLGLAYDGDGDRVIAVDNDGNVVDGDFIMAVCGRYLKEKGRLPRNTVVTTVMTNLGFHLAMKELGIDVITTDVGDRYVLEEMLAGGYGFGGEQSGHIINLETSTTGDGLATSLLLLQVMSETGLPLGRLARVMQRLPQKLVNVQVPDRNGLDGRKEIWDKIEEEEARLKGNGRILVRSSGTEPVIRVMVEAATVDICDDICENVAVAIKQHLGKD